MRNSLLINSIKLFILVITTLCLFNTASFAQSCSFTGSWDSNFGKMKLKQSGGQISGTLGNTGQISGTIQGYIMQAKYWNNGAYAGDVVFYISPDCSKLHGEYNSFGEPERKWEATRIYTKPHPPSSPPPDTVQQVGGYGLPTYSNNSYNQPTYNILCNWDGVWSTGLGNIYMTQTDARTVIGAYTHNNGKDGHIKGTISGNKFTGTWTQSPTYQPPKDAGQCVFTISTDCRSFKGTWRYGYNQQNNKWGTGWNGTKIK